MQKTVTFEELVKDPVMVREDVVSHRTAYILTHNQRPALALIPYDDYERYRRFSEEAILDRFDRTLERLRSRARSGGFTDEEINRDVESIRTDLAR